MSDFDEIMDLVNKHAKERQQQREQEEAARHAERSQGETYRGVRLNSSTPRRTPTTHTPAHTRPQPVKYVSQNAGTLSKGKTPKKKLANKTKKYRRAGVAAILLFTTLWGFTMFAKNAISVKNGDTPAPSKPAGIVNVDTSVSPRTTSPVFETQSVAPEESTEPETPDEQKEIVDKYANPDEHIYIQSWSDGKKYYVCDEDYVVYLANQALQNIRDTISEKNPDSKYLDILDAGYIDASLLAGQASVESDFRIKDTDGEIVHNGDTAFGMTQGTRPTMDTVNREFAVYNFHYDEDVLIDPVKALEFTALLHMYNSQHYLRNAIDITDPKNADLARWYCACAYYHGGNGAYKFLNNGTLRDQRYPTKVMSRVDKLAEKYGMNTDYAMGD